MNHNDNLTLSNTTIYLHWAVALLIIGLLGSGIYMTETKTYHLYDWHKSFGVIAVLFVISRIIWRLKEGWPSHLDTHKPVEINLARLVQNLLLISPVIMVFSGILMASSSGHGLEIFDWNLVPANPNPENPMEVIPTNDSLASLGETIHIIFGYVLVVSLVLHGAGAVKHHFIDRDSTLKRIIKVNAQPEE